MRTTPRFTPPPKVFPAPHPGSRRAVSTMLAFAALLATSTPSLAQSLGNTIISRTTDVPRVQLWDTQSSGWPEVAVRVDRGAYVVVFAVTHPGRVSQIRVLSLRTPGDELFMRGERTTRIANIGNWPRVRDAYTYEERQVLLVAFASDLQPDMTEFRRGRNWNNEQSYEILTRDPQEMADALAQVIYGNSPAKYDVATLTVYANPRNIIASNVYGPNYGLGSSCSLHNSWLRTGYMTGLRDGQYRSRYGDPRWPDRTQFTEGFGGGFPFWLVAYGYSAYDPYSWERCLGYRAPTWAVRAPERPVVGAPAPQAPTRSVPLPGELTFPRFPIADSATRIDPPGGSFNPGTRVDPLTNPVLAPPPVTRREPPSSGPVTVDPVTGPVRAPSRTEPKNAPPQIDPVQVSPPTRTAPRETPREAPPVEPVFVNPPTRTAPREPPRVDPPVSGPVRYPVIEPVRVEPTRPPVQDVGGPPRYEPARIEPVREPPRQEPVRVEPVREPPRSEPVRVEPVREPPRQEPVRVEPVREPPRQEPVRVEPVRTPPPREVPPPRADPPPQRVEPPPARVEPVKTPPAEPPVKTKPPGGN